MSNVLLTIKFESWILQNPQVIEAFVKYARMAKDKGHTKISAWLIANRVRWESEIETTGDDYKLNNNYISFIARKVMNEYPDLNNFFTMKKMKD